MHVQVQLSHIRGLWGASSSLLPCTVSSGLAAVPFPSQRLLARPNVFLKDASYTPKVLYFIFVSPVYLELMVCSEAEEDIDTLLSYDSGSLNPEPA